MSVNPGSNRHTKLGAWSGRPGSNRRHPGVVFASLIEGGENPRGLESGVWRSQQTRLASGS
jgi:hypothetical protein